MTLLHAVILGVVEGLTEFLPVSSTGHLILAKAALGLRGESVDHYVIVIQLGALGAVVFHYRRRLLEMLRGLAAGGPGRRLPLQLMVAFLPAAGAGFLLHDRIERLLFGNVPVAAALVLGGVAMLASQAWLGRRGATRDSLEGLSMADAWWIGVAQCFSLWPGMSRSMTTIVGAQLRGCGNAVAADFSFLLALPTLGAATLYTLLKHRADFLATQEGGLSLAVGLAVSFVVALFAIRGFIGFVTRRGMWPFAVYRIALGVLVLALSAAGLLRTAG